MKGKSRKGDIIFWLAAGLLVILGLALAIPTLRVRSAVEEYKAALKAHGEKLEIDELIPRPASTDRDRTALILELSKTLSNSPSIQPIAMRLVGAGEAEAAFRQPDIRTKTKTNSWEELEIELAKHEHEIELLRMLPERTDLDFHLNYHGGSGLLLPELSKISRLAHWLAASALSELRQGHNDKAAASLHGLLALCGGLQEEPLVISQSVADGLAEIAFGVQWEWLESRGGNEADLASLQRDWLALDGGPAGERAVSMARAMISEEMARWRKDPKPLVEVLKSMDVPIVDGSGIESWIWELRQSAATSMWRASWSSEDEMRIFQTFQIIIETFRKIQSDGYFIEALSAQKTRLAALGLDKDFGGFGLRRAMNDPMEKLFNGTSQFAEDFLEKSLTSQAYRALAIAALAVRRYELVHEELPPDLEALAPEFSSAPPRDPVDGKILRYRRNSDGGFLLYSVGRDGVDGGGNGASTNKESGFLSGKDWVWPRAATEP